ncbi:TlpA disulfide reductase family protein [Alkalihalobacterium elongatum]|uniref:TlpA disulfide reductase family protein n=1 Tax=Alkalihalobacterium elongatum TaxID=2675466 RepID=UPI001C1FB2EF|nr:TlpA disulfide reductase family protein [Alkalihalobacterium elongatum]
MNRRLISILTLVIAAGLIIFVIVTDREKPLGVEKGLKAIDFTLPVWGEEEGVEASLSDYEGDVIILNFWATWCPPCKDEMPDFMQFQEDYGDLGIKVVTVNMYYYERRATVEEDIQNFMEEVNVTLPTLLDKEGEVNNTYQPPGFPMTYIIDRERVIQQVVRGEVNYEMLERLVLPIAEETE